MDTGHDDRTPRLGEVYLMKFSGGKSEQRGWRPGIVFQNNVGNVLSPNIIAIPLTSVIKKTRQPTHVVIKAEDVGLKVNSMALCENPERMSKSKVGKYLTTLSDEYMRQIAEAYLLATSAIAFLDQDTILRIRDEAEALNGQDQLLPSAQN